MQFITVKQHNHEVDETIIHFLQWNGNEDELKKLFKLIEVSLDAHILETKDYSDFEYDDTKFISEATVNEMIQLKYGFEVNMFQKHTGTFRAPKLTNNKDLYDEETQKMKSSCANMARDELHNKYHMNEMSDWFY